MTKEQAESLKPGQELRWAKSWDRKGSLFLHCPASVFRGFGETVTFLCNEEKEEKDHDGFPIIRVQTELGAYEFTSAYFE